MKTNAFLSVISVVIAALLAYLAYHIASDEANAIVCGIGALICFSSTLIPTIGIQYDSSKLGVNIKTLSVMFFVVFAISQFCFAAFGVAMPYYIIINGLILTIYLAIIYKMQGNKDI